MRRQDVFILTVVDTFIISHVAVNNMSEFSGILSIIFKQRNGLFSLRSTGPKGACLYVLALPRH
jgi:hypothetical protein